MRPSSAPRAWRSATGGPTLWEFAKVQASLAMIERHRRRYPEARAAYERALAIYARVPGKRSSTYSQTLGNLAFLLSSQGDHEAAIAAYQRAGNLERQLGGKKTDTLALLLTNQADAYSKAGRYAEALASAREALSIRTATLGPRHVEVGVTLFVVGEALRKQGSTPRRWITSSGHARSSRPPFPRTTSTRVPSGAPSATRSCSSAGSRKRAPRSSGHWRFSSGPPMQPRSRWR